MSSEGKAEVVAVIFLAGFACGALLVGTAVGNQRDFWRDAYCWEAERDLDFCAEIHAEREKFNVQIEGQ